MNSHNIYVDSHLLESELRGDLCQRVGTQCSHHEKVEFMNLLNNYGSFVNMMNDVKRIILHLSYDKCKSLIDCFQSWKYSWMNKVDYGLMSA